MLDAYVIMRLKSISMPDISFILIILLQDLGEFIIHDHFRLKYIRNSKGFGI